MVRSLISRIIYLVINFFCAFLLLVCAVKFRFQKKNQIIFGTTPIISYAYWSRALKEKGMPSCTLMKTIYHINSREDFDLLYSDITPNILRRFEYICKLFAFLFILKKASLFITSYDSIIFDDLFESLEIIFLKIARVKVVILPYGSDAYTYSNLKDPSIQHALLLSYPRLARYEDKILRNIRWRNKYADVVVCGFQNEGIGRWDLLIHQFCQIDAKSWTPKDRNSKADGVNECVRIIHTPNHMGFKGTEFIRRSLEILKNEGLKLEYIELSGVLNSEVKKHLLESDILIDQLIFTGYALSGIEGMAIGLPVLANLESSFLTDVFRRYSFLNECPIVSATPETITDVLRVLIANPKLREELGLAARQYVEKYHSYEISQYIFGAIYDKIIHNKDVDLMNLFHPLLSEYNRATPYIQHPLKNNKLPERYFKEIA